VLEIEAVFGDYLIVYTDFERMKKNPGNWQKQPENDQADRDAYSRARSVAYNKDKIVPN